MTKALADVVIRRILSHSCERIKDQDLTPRALPDSWRFMPLFSDPHSFTFNTPPLQRANVPPVDRVQAGLVGDICTFPTQTIHLQKPFHLKSYTPEQSVAWEPVLYLPQAFDSLETLGAGPSIHDGYLNVDHGSIHMTSHRPSNINMPTPLPASPEM